MTPILRQPLPNPGVPFRPPATGHGGVRPITFVAGLLGRSIVPTVAGEPPRHPPFFPSTTACVAPSPVCGTLIVPLTALKSP